MEESIPLLDAVILVAGVVLILITSVRVSRQRSQGKTVKGRAGALIGVAVWLAVLGVAVYLIFR
jgi:hypothetical protein